jgi:MmyB-like transcription regulator ligand binding domain
VSIEYYTRLKRGNLGGVSEAVLDSLVAALQLDQSERAYLFDLVKAASAPSTPRGSRKATAQEVRPSIQRLLDAMTGGPGVRSQWRAGRPRGQREGRALYSQAFDSPAFDSPAFDSPGRPMNLARFVFLDPRAQLLHPNWSDPANTSVSILRTEAGRNPYDNGLTDLVGELSTRSEEFRPAGRRTTSGCTGRGPSTSTTRRTATCI